MRQIRKFWSNFENMSHDSRATFVRVSHHFPANVTYFHLNSYDSRATLVLFSRQIVARFSQDCRATVMRHSRDIRTSVAKISHSKFAKISRRQVRDTRTTVARQSCQIFWRKNSHKIFQHVEKLRDQFATSSRHKKILTTLARHSHECRAKVRDKIRQTVARNSHASEILALLKFGAQNMKSR